jgi:hypothetical protein
MSVGFVISILGFIALTVFAILCIRMRKNYSNIDEYKYHRLSSVKYSDPSDVTTTSGRASMASVTAANAAITAATTTII